MRDAPDQSRDQSPGICRQPGPGSRPWVTQLPQPRGVCTELSFHTAGRAGGHGRLGRGQSHKDEGTSCTRDQVLPARTVPL